MKIFLLVLLAAAAAAGSFLAGRSYERSHFALEAQSWTDGVYWGWCAGRNGVGFGGAVKEAYFQKTVAAKDPEAKPLREAHQKVLLQADAVETLTINGDTK